jgi:hypothetical protein
MTRLLAAATGRGTRWIHVLASVLTLLVMASYADRSAGMRTDAFTIALIIIGTADVALCSVWRIVRVWIEQIAETRR